MGFLPGLALFGPAFGLPLSLLAGILERPFYSRAGVSRSAIWFSLQANFISLLVGYLMLPIALFGLYNAAILWFPVSVFISTAVERSYLKWRVRDFDGNWKQVGWANVLSALAIVGVLLLSVPFNTPANKSALLPYYLPLTSVGIAISAVAFLMAFIMPWVQARRSSTACQIAGTASHAD